MPAPLGHRDRIGHFEDRFVAMIANRLTRRIRYVRSSAIGVLRFCTSAAGNARDEADSRRPCG
jgi:hypothetical protein